MSDSLPDKFVTQLRRLLGGFASELSGIDKDDAVAIGMKRAIEAWNTKPDQLVTFYFKAAKNKVYDELDKLQAKKRTPRDPTIEETRGKSSPSPEEEFIREESLTNQRTAVDLLFERAELSEDEKQVLTLRFVEEQIVDDIAKNLGVSRSTINNRLSSAKSKLKGVPLKQLAKEGRTPGSLITSISS